MQTEQEKISVLIRTHNRSILLRKCLESLIQQTYTGNYDILVIDSASTDDTESVVYNFSKSNSRIHYVYEPIAGAARARKKGLEVANGDILVWIDDDCTADKAWLGQIVSAFSLNEKVDIVGGQTIINWEIKRPSWLPEILEPTLGKQKLADSFTQVNMVNGANIAYRASIAKKITFDMSSLGPSGKSKRVMSEDAEFCSQARMLGAKIYYVPNAFVYHFVSKQQSTLKYFLGRHYALGRSDAIRHQLAYPMDKIDWLKRTIKGLSILLRNLGLFFIKLPLRILNKPKYILLDAVYVIQSFSYLIEEIKFFFTNLYTYKK